MKKTYGWMFSNLSPDPRNIDVQEVYSSRWRYTLDSALHDIKLPPQYKPDEKNGRLQVNRYLNNNLQREVRRLDQVRLTLPKEWMVGKILYDGLLF
jgi:hypothetical protein